MNVTDLQLSRTLVKGGKDPPPATAYDLAAEQALTRGGGS